MLIHSAVITGSVQLNNTDVSGITNVAGFATTASVNTLVVKTGSYATTGSNQFNGNQSISGSITSNGTITAQTLVVQTVTSSIEFITGSTKNGSLAANTHQFTGSVLMSGDLTVNSDFPATFNVTSTANSATYGGVTISRQVNTVGNGNGLAFAMYNSVNASAEYAYIGTIIETNTSTSQNGAIIFAPTYLGTRTERMRITSAGNVGIGVTNPAVKLQLDGSLTLKSNSNQTIQLWNSGSVAANIGGNLEFRGTYRNSDLDSVVYSRIFGGKENASDGNFAGYMSFSTYQFPNSLAERMRITSDGNVGIGTTTPGYRLHIGDLSNSVGDTNDIFLTGDKIGADGYYARLILGNSSRSGGSSASIRGERNGNNYGTALTFYTNDTNAAGNGTERMRISNTGVITKPYNPAFRAYYTTNSTWTLASGDAFVFNATEYNIGSCYNTSNGRFTAPVAGVYQFNFYTIILGAYTNGEVNFQKNGADFTSASHIHFTTNAGSTWNNVHFVTSVYLNSGDWVHFVNRGQSVIYHGDDWSSFSGYLVG